MTAILIPLYFTPLFCYFIPSHPGGVMEPIRPSARIFPQEPLIVKSLKEAVASIKTLPTNKAKSDALKEYYRPELAKMLQHEIHVQRAVDLETVLKELAWPDHLQEMAGYEQFLQTCAFSEGELQFACFDSERDFKQALLQKFEEISFHQRGIVPKWVLIKRDTPKAQAFMVKAQTGSLPSLGFIRGDTSKPGYPFPYGAGGGMVKASGFQGDDYLSNEKLRAISAYLTTKGKYGDFRYVAGLQKGGLGGILDICLDGAIYTPWVGTLSLDVGRDESQGRHGPWYAVMVEDFDEKEKPFSNSLEISLEKIETFLVPHVEDKNYLLHALQNGERLRLITPERVQQIAAKVKTYTEYQF